MQESVCHLSIAAASAHPNQYSLRARSETATQRVAQLLAAEAQAGDCICLYGDVGAGKSVFRCAMVAPVMQVGR